MLYGYLPFQSNYFEEIRDMTINCSIELTNNHWSNVSEEAKDLIKKILTSDDKRITTKKILEHPWIKNIEHLKDYEGKNKKRIRIL
jgi:serine/threonine protein kinase